MRLNRIQLSSNRYSPCQTLPIHLINSLEAISRSLTQRKLPIIIARCQSSRTRSCHLIQLHNYNEPFRSIHRRMALDDTYRPDEDIRLFFADKFEYIRLNVLVLVITSEAGYHSVYGGCSVDFLRAAGVRVDHIRLPDVGIHGNGHMMFMEKNNLQIADEVVRKWLIEVF